MRTITVLLVFLSQLIAYKVVSQDSTLFYSADIQAAISTNTVPFWIRSNQYGSVPERGSFLLTQAGLYQVYNKNNPRTFQWSGGIQVVADAGKTSSIFLSDLYLAGKAGPFELSIGQKKEFTGLGDSLMSIGSIAVSQNFRPFPKIQLSSPRFTNIIPGFDLLSFRFSYSDGLLGAATVQNGSIFQVPQTYFHQKFLYLRLGGEHQKLSLYAGFNHQAMWGGEARIWNGGLKTGAAYRYVIVGKPWFNSRVGNHFGTIDLAAEWRGKSWNIFVYRQNIYEDGSLAKLSNIKDGLNGLRFQRKTRVESATLFVLNAILVEYLYTKSQGGAIFDYDAGIFGNDNYFNHYVYQQGWSYKGRSIGTPLIGPKALNRSELPAISNQYTNNNRLSAIHLALQGSWREIVFTAKGTFSNNFGTYSVPFSRPAKQANLYIRAEKPISFRIKSLLTLSLATDLGKLYPNSVAVMVGWKKTGYLNSFKLR